MTTFIYKISWRGTNGKETVKTYDLGDFAEGTPGADFEAALVAAGQVKASAEALSNAVAAQETLTHTYGLDNSVPADADISEELVLALALTGKATTGLSSLPAPVIGAFVASNGSNRDICDINDADVQTHVTQLEQHTVISDGDTIDAAAGVGGLMRGYRRVVRSRVAKLAR